MHQFNGLGKFFKKMAYTVTSCANFSEPLTPIQYTVTTLNKRNNLNPKLAMTSIIKWQCATIDELSASQMHAILKARCDVFIVEQNCAFPEIDDVDLIAHHLVAWTESDQLAAYLRILPPNSTFAEPSLGRVLSAPAFRGTGIGRQLINQGLKQLEARYPALPVRIGAQSYLIQFYGSFGFEIASEEYLEDGIAHVEMVRAVSIKT
jgi:ElaA protein